MSNLFFGILFLYLTVNVDLTLFGRTVSIDLLSNIIGYLLFYAGLKELREENESFDRLRGNIIPLIVVSALVTLLAFLDLGSLSGLLAIAEIILAFYATRQIVRGVEDMEKRYRCDMRAPRLKQLWKRYLVLQILTTAASVPGMLIALLGGSMEMLGFLVIVILVAAICLLVTVIQTFIAFSFARNQYEAIQAGEEPKGGYRPPEGGEAAEAPDGPEMPEAQEEDFGEPVEDAPSPGGEP